MADCQNPKLVGWTGTQAPPYLFADELAVRKDRFLTVCSRSFAVHFGLEGH
jgi:hypothetical protein